MKGLDIFLHSLKQVLGNLSGAIQVSAIPYAIQFVAAFVLTRPDKTASMAGDPMAMMQNQPSIVAVLLSLLVTIATSVWIAVAWHRFVLKNEVPSGFVPPIHADRMLGYFLRALGIGLICIVLFLLLGFVAGLIGGAIAYATGSILVTSIFVAVIVYFPIFVVTYRLSTSLPAPAVADGAGPFMAGWEATKGDTGTFIVLSVISAAILFANGFLSLYVFGGSMVLFLIWTLVFNWLATMVGLSILTTLYSHYVEKRELV